MIRVRHNKTHTYCIKVSIRAYHNTWLIRFSFIYLVLFQTDGQLHKDYTHNICNVEFILRFNISPFLLLISKANFERIYFRLNLFAHRTMCHTYFPECQAKSFAINQTNDNESSSWKLNLCIWWYVIYTDRLFYISAIMTDLLLFEQIASICRNWVCTADLRTFMVHSCVGTSSLLL